MIANSLDRNVDRVVIVDIDIVVHSSRTSPKHVAEILEVITSMGGVVQSDIIIGLSSNGVECGQANSRLLEEGLAID